MVSRHILDQVKNYENYKSLDFTNKIYQVKALRFAESLKIKQPKILELGCADGSFTALLKEKLKGSTWGVDITPENIVAAKKLGVKATVHDLANRLPYHDNFFDLVVGLEIIEHVFDTDYFLSEIYRVLKPGGCLILSTPNLASLVNRGRLFFGLYPNYLGYRPVDGHVFLYTLPILCGHLERHRLEVETASSPNFFNPLITKSWLPKIIREWSMALGDLWPTLGSHLLLVARKK